MIPVKDKFFMDVITSFSVSIFESKSIDTIDIIWSIESIYMIWGIAYVTTIWSIDSVDIIWIKDYSLLWRYTLNENESETLWIHVSI